MMLPFLAGLGIREWVHDHATALMWTVAIIIASVIAFWDQLHRLRTPHAAPLPLSSPDAEELARLRRLETGWKEQERYRANRETLLQFGPRLLIGHTAGSDGFEHLAIRNITKAEARNVKIIHIRIKKEYLLTSIPEEVPLVDRNSRDEVKIQPIVSSFAEIVKMPGRHWLLVDFDDESHLNHFRQEFEIVVREDGSVEFQSADVKLAN